MGRDSDHPMAAGEVGRVGVAIDSLDDMRVLFDGIPLAEISTSMTINATAATLLALYIAVGEEQGAGPGQLRGTIQNDILKEYIARGTYIYPPAGSMRIITDTFTYCSREVPQWNTVSISGYHIREAGADAVQEVAFTLADGITYVEAALAAGLDVDDFAPRLSFFFNVHNNFLEEVAKFRAARRMWARIMRDRFGAKSAKSQMLRFHTQTAGVTLQAQQPLVNVVRVTLQALAAVLGGTQSLHTNSFDEALGLPTELAATIALRTQQVIAHESGVADFIDPLGGSYAIETLTGEIEAGAARYLDEIERAGRGRRRDRARLHPARDRAPRLRAPARGRAARAHRRRGQRVRGRRRGAGRGRHRRPAARARPGRAGPGDALPPRPGRDRPRPARPRRRRAGAAPTCCRPSSARSRRWPRSARSPTSCARSSASTSPRGPSDRPAGPAEAHPRIRPEVAENGLSGRFRGVPGRPPGAPVRGPIPIWRLAT